MKCEILEYKTEFSWELDSFLTEPNFKSLIDPNWPTIVATYSPMAPNGDDIVYREYASDKKRSKPSVLQHGTPHNTISLAGEKLGMKRQVFMVYAACAGSLYSLYLASLMSLENQTPVVLFAADRANDYPIWFFKSFGACDQETGRPFDKTSRGFRMGTGMALYIVKHPSVKSNLDPKAVIQNFHFYTNPALIAHPGAVDDIVSNLSNVNYKDIEFWNAHATGTPVGDLAEYQYFSKTCKQDIPIVSFKGQFGHCMAAAGAMEIAMALDCKKNNLLVPNVIQGDKLIDDPRIITEPIPFTFKKMFKASLGFGGKTVVAEIDLL